MAKTVRVIPAKPKAELVKEQQKGRLRVAAYCRVSTDDEEQLTSYQNQIEYYTEKINSNPAWEMAGVYADEYTSYGQNPKRPWIPTISVFTGVFIIQSLLTLPT